MFKLTQYFSTKATPQSQPMPGTTQLPNSAGGYTWSVNDWVRLDRFLILGSEGGTYYISEKKLTIDNAEALVACLATDGPRVIAQEADVERHLLRSHDPERVREQRALERRTHATQHGPDLPHAPVLTDRDVERERAVELRRREAHAGHPPT